MTVHLLSYRKNESFKNNFLFENKKKRKFFFPISTIICIHHRYYVRVKKSDRLYYHDVHVKAKI